MSKLVAQTTTVTGDEKVWDYAELDKPSLIPGKGMRRYRIAQLHRNGENVMFEQDLGPAKRFKKKRQLHIPSFDEHTFDELVFLAEQLHDESPQDLIDVLELAGMENPERVIIH